MPPCRKDNRNYSPGSQPFKAAHLPERSAIQATAQPSLRTYDNNGNVIGYWNEDGDLVTEYAYDAFGNTISSSGSMASVFPHRFSTKYYDAETDLYYYGYRYYSPSLGRWISRDPIEEEGGLNLYLICRNATLYSYDKQGLDPVFSMNPPTHLNLTWAWKAIDSKTKGGETQPFWTNRCCVIKIDLKKCQGATSGECWGIEYKVAIVLQVFLNSNPNPFSDVPDLAYGHEQKHVEAYIKEVDEHIKPLLSNIAKYSSPYKATAKQQAKLYEEDIEKKIGEINYRGRNHIHPHPKSGLGVIPIGTRPAKPSKQPDPPTGFSCCEP